MDFALPEFLPRVSAARISIQLARFDFKQYLKNFHGDWVREFAAESAPPVDGQCKETSTHVMSTHLIDGVVETISSTFNQSTSGMITFTIILAVKSDPMIAKLRTTRMADQTQSPCVVEWKTEPELQKQVAAFTDMRNLFITALDTPVGFDGSDIGKRLSRSPALAPDASAPKADAEAPQPEVVDP